MTKRYAPPVPDPSYHRPKDAAYFHELLNAAGLSQRAAGPALGLHERSVRNRVAYDSWSYPEQFMLEVLADAKLSQAVGVWEAAPRYGEPSPVPTAWHKVADRKLTAADAGKLVVGRDEFGAPIQGTLTKDGFGVVIKSIDGLDVHNIPVDRIELYTLLDPPPADRATETT